MIVYDSHRWWTMYQWRGSIFPKAIVYAIPSTVLSFCLKHFDIFEFSELDKMQNGTIYSGFTFVLGFILVFRTSQSYQRYWCAATAVHNMRTEWLDACGSLIAFAQASKCTQEAINRFSHTMIRLFALMHAMALEEIASMEDENFPLLDIEGLEKEHLRVLTSEPAQGRKVEIVCQWIKVFMLRSMEEKILDVPAPILTRVFQEIGSGLVKYHEALQIVIWPFPFPYAQMSAVLISVYMFVTPVVITLWAAHSWYCAVATLISVVCMKGIDIIAVELENPFGDDANDLPSFQMHHAMNRDLTLLVNPATWKVPMLLKTARVSFEELVSMNDDNKMSLDQYYKKSEEFQKPVLESMKSMVGFGDTDKKTELQKNWAKQNWASSIGRANRVLRLAQISKDGEGRVTSKEIYQQPSLGSEPSACSIQITPPPAPAPDIKMKAPQSSPLLGAVGDVMESKCKVTKGAEPPWRDFLRELSSQLQEHFKQQLQQQDTFYERNLRAAADVVCELRALELTLRSAGRAASEPLGDAPVAARGGLVPPVGHLAAAGAAASPEAAAVAASLPAPAGTASQGPSGLLVAGSAALSASRGAAELPASHAARDWTMSMPGTPEQEDAGP